MSKKHAILGISSVILGAYWLVHQMPISIGIVRSISDFPLSGITLSTTLLLPLVIVVAGVVLAFGKMGAGYVLALGYFCPFALYALAVVEYFNQLFTSSYPSAMQNAVAWKLIGGMVFFGLLAVMSVAVAKYGSQYNKSLKRDALKGAP